jgi:hypothetical protein
LIGRFSEKSLAKAQWSNIRWVFLFTEKESAALGKVIQKKRLKMFKIF